jgi:hypothetical protein
VPLASLLPVLRFVAIAPPSREHVATLLAAGGSCINASNDP